MSHVHSPDLIGNAREQWVNPTGGLLASVESPHPFRSCYSGTYLNKGKMSPILKSGEGVVTPSIHISAENAPSQTPPASSQAWHGLSS